VADDWLDMIAFTGETARETERNASQPPRQPAFSRYFGQRAAPAGEAARNVLSRQVARVN